MKHSQQPEVSARLLVLPATEPLLPPLLEGNYVYILWLNTFARVNHKFNSQRKNPQISLHKFMANKADVIFSLKYGTQVYSGKINTNSLFV